MSRFTIQATEAHAAPEAERPATRRRRPRFTVPAVVALAAISLYVVATLFAGWIAPYGQGQIVSQVPFDAWSDKFIFGTDQLGRDVFSRLIYGAQNTVGIAFATTCLSFAAGVTLGSFAALSPGWTDQALSRAVDVLMAIPQLVFALVLLAICGTSMVNLVLIMAVIDSTRVYRLSRSVAMNVAAAEFVQVAELRGESKFWILSREILPNMVPTIVAEFGMRFCFVFLTIAALSFLGVGIQPPAADWGSMVRESATLITYGDPTPLLPAAAIAILAISINVVIDWYLNFIGGNRDER
ncbi:ABC transporter permease [Aliidongia dinghuensis]|uniref:ABC transporter permease n=1 Tax=Aliidongia dinghuensis TaxID=1867774 RepID=A0A8J2Z038_9PROT|nr:ABC transporter permease [Aliidongia dinghuensis]GGF42987.1 ABC transporter permease [Aliidongia dinghuensis]